MSRRFDELRLGAMLLTRLPVGRIAGDAPTVASSTWSWPLVGLAVGSIAASVWVAAMTLGLPSPLAAALAILATVLATGGLHEDGLADLADGIGGSRDPQRALEIMRDSRIGTFGALALGFSLLIRTVALASLGAAAGGWALIALASASRASMPMALRLMPPARQDGLGKGAGGVRMQTATVALILGAGALCSLGPATALVAGLAMMLAATGLGALALRRIGGQTGDVLGAMQQVAELSGWIVIAAML